MVIIRIPGAYLATLMFAETLSPMGLAAPLGSLLSAFICIYFYKHLQTKEIQKALKTS